MCRTIIILCLILSICGCAGTGFDRKTSLMPDEFSIAQKINTETWNIGPELTLGVKWKFK